jgi:hypothetical protein
MKTEELALGGLAGLAGYMIGKNGLNQGGVGQSSKPTDEQLSLGETISGGGAGSSSGGAKYLDGRIYMDGISPLYQDGTISTPCGTWQDVLNVMAATKLRKVYLLKPCTLDTDMPDTIFEGENGKVYQWGDAFGQWSGWLDPAGFNIDGCLFLNCAVAGVSYVGIKGINSIFGVNSQISLRTNAVRIYAQNCDIYNDDGVTYIESGCALENCNFTPIPGKTNTLDFSLNGVVPIGCWISNHKGYVRISGLTVPAAGNMIMMQGNEGGIYIDNSNTVGIIAIAGNVAVTDASAGAGVTVMDATTNTMIAKGGIDTTGLVAGSGSIADNVAANLLLRYIADHVGGSPPSGAEILLETYLQTVNLSGYLSTGVLPSFAAFVQLGQFDVSSNPLTGALPSFGTCPLLQEIYLNDNGFTGIIPSFAACTDLRNFIANNNLFSGYIPTCFENQANLGAINLSNNAIANDADINQILADLISSLSLPGRVACTVNLTGGTNAAPTGQGLLDKITLNGTAGWTVTTN